jgi:Ca2+-binding EF-hand superfamily protein
MKSKSFIITVATLMLMHSVVFAADAGARGDKMAQLKTRFDQADANHDGQLTRDEAKAGMPRVYSQFDAIDTRHQGFVTMDDIKTFAAGKMGSRKKGAATAN